MSPESDEPGRPEPAGDSALLEKVAKLPSRPGVYLLKDARSRVLYVGKAKSLRDRVRSYFRSDAGDGRLHVRFLMQKVRELEVSVTSTEKEALILEDTLIKRHRPRYNIRLRDDKTYTSIRIDLRHAFPRVQVERRPSRQGAIVLGPYASAAAVRRTVKELHQLFPLRTCTDSDFANRTRPCLDHQIGRCVAPCVGYVGEEDYARLVKGAVHFLRGQNREVIDLLEGRMREAASAERFEEAGRLRDRVAMIRTTVERQQVVRQVDVDQDYVVVAVKGARAEAAVLTVRGGVLVGVRTHPLTLALEGDDDPLGAFLSRRYGSAEDLPDEIVIAAPVESMEALAEWLSERRGRRVRLTVPERGEKRRLLGMAEENARTALTTRTDPAEQRRALIGTVARKLKLSEDPRRIECVDMSTLGGTGSVGSLVRFEDAEPARQGYRRFRIQAADEGKPDDYGHMREVLERRFKAARDLSQDPELLVVDGGRGQLNVAVAVFRELEIEHVALASIAKDPDRVFRPGRSNPISLRGHDPVLLLFGAMRDEAHRFAITYQRKVRSRERIRSDLDDLPGIGTKRRNALLTHFGSLKALRGASEQEIAAVPGFGATTARTLRAWLKESGRARGAKAG